MTLANSLNVDDLTTELEIGRGTVNFILERFNPQLRSHFSNRNHLYSPSVIPLLIKIRDLMSSGMLPSQVESILENEALGPTPAPPKNQAPDNEIRMNQEALAFIQEMVSDIRGHQGRIARAHEKRAQAEERKAVAIENRAKAEDKKADAMNNIAMALQEMNQLRAVDSQTMEVAGQAARALTMDEPMSPPDDPGEFDAPDTQSPGDDDVWKTNHLVGNDSGNEEWDDDFEDPLAGMSELLDHPEPESQTIETVDLEGLSEDLDDLSLLADDPGLCEGDLDDLSALIDTVSEPAPESDDLDGLLEEDDVPLPEPDDLSLLVDSASDSAETDLDIDNLYSLVEGGPSDTDMDDLSLLVGQDLLAESEDMDDLSILIDPEPEENTVEAVPMDDLSLLLDPPAPNKEATDDLWTLVDTDEGRTNIPMDDLSDLLDPVETAPPNPPSLKPDITPEQDLTKYKAAVMKIIIQLKSDGLSPKQTTDRLNRDEVSTLSGKPSWAENAIAKIYGFIDSAQ